MNKIVRFTGIPFQGQPWPLSAPWQKAENGDPYKALLPVEGNEEHVKLLLQACACTLFVCVDYASELLQEI